MCKKIAIIGTSFGKIDDTLKINCFELGKWLAENKYLVITGACPGISYYVGDGVIKNGGKVKGYTPAKDITEHCNLYKFPNEGYSELEFIKEKYEINEVYFRRSINAIHNADIVVSLDGGRGTMSELFLATFFSKKIICADFSEGATKEFIKIHHYLKNVNIEYGEEVLIAKNLEDIKNIIKNLCS